MTESNSPPPTPGSNNRRRASFSPGASFSEIFTRGGSTNNGQPAGTPAFPSAMASVMGNQNRRRVSITTVGLSGSPSQNNPFSSITRRHGGSISSSQGSASPQFEEAVLEDHETAAPTNTPSSPFARRVSFGAQALRDVRSGSGSSNGTRNPSHTVASSPPAAAAVGKGRGEGFNWSDALRDKAGRVPSISGMTPASPTIGRTTSMHARSATVATMEPPKQMPSPKPVQIQRPKPDPTQERILRGDFYMD